MFLSAKATHLTAPVVLVMLYDVSPSAVQNMGRHNRPLNFDSFRLSLALEGRATWATDQSTKTKTVWTNRWRRGCRRQGLNWQGQDKAAEDEAIKDNVKICQIKVRTTVLWAISTTTWNLPRFSPTEKWYVKYMLASEHFKNKKNQNIFQIACKSKLVSYSVGKNNKTWNTFKSIACAK